MMPSMALCRSIPCGILFCILAFHLNVVGSLKCYRCENEQSNAMCINEGNLAECEADLDTCQTLVGYSDVSAKLSITKTCTKRTSCQLQVNVSMATQPCDRSRVTWVCTTCCFEDLCNFNGTSTKDCWKIIHLTLTCLLLYCVVGNRQ